MRNFLFFRLLLGFLIVLPFILSVRMGLAQGKPDLVWMRGAHPSTVATSFFADGSKIATAGPDRTVKIRSLPDGQLLQTLVLPSTFSGSISGIAVTQDGQRILVAGGNGGNIVALFRISDGTAIWTRSIYVSGGIKFSPNEKYILLGGYAVLRASDGSSVTETLPSSGDWGFSPNSTELAYGGISTYNFVEKYFNFDTNTTRQYTYVNDTDYTSARLSAYSPDGSRVAFFRQDYSQRNLSIFNPSNGSFISLLELTPFDYNRLIWNDLGLFGLGGVHSDTSGTGVAPAVKRWDPDTKTETTLYVVPDDFSFQPSSFSLSQDGTQFAVGGGGNTDSAKFSVRSGLDGSEIYTAADEHRSAVQAVAISPDGTTMATGSSGGTIKLWQLSDGVLQRTLYQNSEVGSIAFSPDGQYLVSGSGTNSGLGNGDIKMWRVADGALLYTLATGSQRTVGIDFSPDGTQFAATNYNYVHHQVRIYRASDGQQLRAFDIDPYSIPQGLKYSPNGQMLAAINQGQGYIWRLSDGALVSTFGAACSYSTAVAYSPDSTLLACGHYNQIYLVNAMTGATLRTLSGHTGEITSLAFSPDGNTLLSSSVDATLRLWNVATGAQLKVYDQETGPAGISIGVRSVDFSPDGKVFGYGRYDCAMGVARNPFFVPLAVAGLGASSVTATSASVSWTTSLSTASTLEYGLTTEYGSSASDTAQTTAHSQNLTGLLPNTLYYYRVQAHGAGQSTMATGTFLTAREGVPQVQVSGYSFTRSGSNVFASLTLANPGTAPATSIQITSASLGSVNAGSLPISVADISIGGSQNAPGVLQFAATSLPSGTRTVLRVNGTYTGGSFSASFRVQVP